MIVLFMLVRWEQTTVSLGLRVEIPVPFDRTDIKSRTRHNLSSHLVCVVRCIVLVLIRSEPFGRRPNSVNREKILVSLLPIRVFCRPVYPEIIEMPNFVRQNERRVNNFGPGSIVDGLVPE